MKKTALFVITALSMLVLIAGLIGCISDEVEDQTLADCRFYSNIIEHDSHNHMEGLHRPYRIHIQDNYFFVCDKGYGIHIYDFSSLDEFKQVAFIELPGNTSFTVKGDYLFADNCNNLMVFDISNPQNPKHVSTTENVMFTWPDYIVVDEYGWEMPYSEEEGFFWNYDGYDDYYEVPDHFYGVCEYETPEKISYTKWAEEYGYDYPYYYDGGGFLTGVEMADSFSAEQYSGNASGSMASFLLVNGYLYVISSDMNLKIFDTTDVENLELANMVYQWDFETIFPFGDYAFFGGMSGMYIYNITDPANPQYVSEFWHGTVCDPVVVSGDYAYVTLRASGDNWCGNTNLNQMDIVDISNLSNPTLVSSYTDLLHPYGLGVDQDTAWVCDGDNGLRILDVSDKEDVVEAGSIEDIDSFDVIPYYEMLFVTGKTGIYLYDYAESATSPELKCSLDAEEPIYDSEGEEITDNNLIEVPEIDME